MAEILAMEMKSAGMYVSRGLSYKQAEVRLVTLFILFVSRWQEAKLPSTLQAQLSYFQANSTCFLFNMQSVFYMVCTGLKST